VGREKQRGEDILPPHWALIQLWKAGVPGAAERQIVDDHRLVGHALKAEGLGDKAEMRRRMVLSRQRWLQLLTARC
jgi:hypothetical protein